MIRKVKFFMCEHCGVVYMEDENYGDFPWECEVAIVMPDGEMNKCAGSVLPVGYIDLQVEVQKVE